MIEVQGPADLAVGDQVEVREYSRFSGDKVRRGVVTKVGKVAAGIRFSPISTASVRFSRKITVDLGWRGPSKQTYFPIRKLTPRDIWLEQSPKSLRVWGGDNGPTLIVDKVAARDEIESTIRDLRAYGMWLNDEPKEGGMKPLKPTKEAS